MKKVILEDGREVNSYCKCDGVEWVNTVGNPKATNIQIMSVSDGCDFDTLIGETEFCSVCGFYKWADPAREAKEK